MNIQKISKITKLKIIISIMVICILLSYFYFEITTDVINIILFSAILSWVLDPLKNRLCKLRFFNEKWASIFIIILMVLLGFLILLIALPKIYNEIDSIADIVDKIYSYIDKFENNSEIKNNETLLYFYDLFKIKTAELIETLSKRIIDNIMVLSESILSMAVIPIVTYYFLSDKKYVLKKIYKLIPLNNREIFKKIIKDSNYLLIRYINGQLYLSIIIGILTFILLMIFKVKFPLVLSILNGILNIIPYFGPIIGAVPIIIVAFVDSSYKGVWVAIFIIIIQQIEGNILSPKITGDSINMHPLTIIILLILGEELFGFIGMIFIVPLAVIIKVIYEDIDYYLF